MLSTYLKCFVGTVIISIILFAACRTAPEPVIDMDAGVPNFGLHDQNGAFHNLYYYSDAKAVVLYVQGNKCPIVRNAITDIRSVRREFRDQGVEFLMINSNVQDDRASIATESEEFDIDFPILKDDAQLVAEALQLHRTAEAIVIDPYSWSVVYRGPINDRIGYESQKNDADQHYLSDALNAHLSGEEIAETYVKGKGCLIKRLHDDDEDFSSISYADDVAPILVDKCMSCHVEGGIAPWQMKNYETVFGWSLMMREVIRTKRMPPFHADPETDNINHDIALTNDELKTIVHWIDAGAKKDGDRDPLAEYKAKAPKWELGEPDLVVQLNEEEIPATGIIDYRYQEHEVNIDQDIWATGFQILPGNREVLHHVLISVIYPDGFLEPIDRSSPWLDGLLAAWAPGGETETFPEHTGRIIPKGSKLHFQMHYTTNGKAQNDQSTVGPHALPWQVDEIYCLVSRWKERSNTQCTELQFQLAAWISLRRAT